MMKYVFIPRETVYIYQSLDLTGIYQSLSFLKNPIYGLEIAVVNTK